MWRKSYGMKLWEAQDQAERVEAAEREAGKDEARALSSYVSKRQIAQAKLAGKDTNAIKQILQGKRRERDEKHEETLRREKGPERVLRYS